MLRPITIGAMKKPHRDEEHTLQSQCVRLFSWKYRELDGLLFAIPNGGRRDPVTGARLKAEGVVAGVADLMLSVPSGRYHGLYIEMKTRRGRQSEVQREWQRRVCQHDYAYAVCRSVEGFGRLVYAYLHGEPVGADAGHEEMNNMQV